MFQVIDEAATEGLLTMGDAVNACRLVFEDLGHGLGRTSNPPAMFLEAGAGGATHFKVKGGYVPALDVCGFRVAGDVGETREEHYCYLIDPESAEPRALVAQTHLHRMRTAATGLLTASLLASRPDPVVALIGSGRIGTCLAQGFADVFPRSELRIASRRPESAVAAANTVQNLAVQAYQTVADAVAGADVIIALSSAREPVLADDAFKPGHTIIGMGEHHELPCGLLFSADRFFVDEFQFATVLGSLSRWIQQDLVAPDEAAARLTGTIGEVATGRVVGRTHKDDRILAIVQGVATADIALAEICRRRSTGAALPVGKFR